MAFDAIMWAKLKQCASLKDGKIPSDQLPSYIDDVIEVASYASLPRPGEKSKIYYTLDTQKSYRWGSSTYILVTSDNFDELLTAEDIADFITEAEVDAKISSIKLPEIDLSGYYTKDETEAEIESAIGKILIPDVSKFITMQDVEDKGYLTEVPSEFITEAELKDKGYLTEHQSLDGLASENYVDEAIAGIVIPKVPTQVSAFANDAGYITEIPETYALKTDIPDISKKADSATTLAGYGIVDAYTKDEFIQQLAGYATETYVKNAIAEAELSDKDVDLTGYATKDEIKDLASEDYVDEQIAAIKFPAIPTKVSEFENDAGYITADDIPKTDLSNYYNKTQTENLVNAAVDNIVIPDTSSFITMSDVEAKNYLTEIPETYITETELADAISSIKPPEVNLDGYATQEWINQQNFAKISDIPSDYITEIPDEYVTNTELSDALAAIQIPDVSGFATKEYVDTAIKNIDSSGSDVPNLVTQEQLSSALSTKADDVLFTDNYVVGLPDGLGSFKNGDSVKNLTLREIIIRMLNLSISDIPEDPELEEITLDNIKPLYLIKNGSSEIASISKDSATIITDNTATEKDSEGLFIDANGNVGYQLQYVEITDDPIPKIYLDPSYTLKAVQVFDVTNNTWVDSDYMFDPVWVWEESPTLETVTVDGKDVELKVYTYNFDETDEVGSTEYRFVVDLAK